jgi:hypothetical protein
MLARLAVIVLGVVSMVASTTGAQAAPTGTTLAVTGLNKAPISGRTWVEH